jgi:nicotinamide-nucleotide amidase
LVSIFSKKGYPILESNKQQAFLPQSCIPLYNTCGTAPGMLFNVDNKLIVSMPGVPYEMKTMMQLDVIPRLKSKFQFPVIVHRTLQTAGVGESFISEKLVKIEAALPEHIKLAYLPSLGIVRLRLTGIGKNEKLLQEEIDMYTSNIKDELGVVVFAEGDISLAACVCSILKEKKQTITLAESCTGGYVSSLIVQIPGCSEYFMGSTIAYSYEAKEMELDVNPDTLIKYGAVSENCINEMLLGAIKKFNTNCAIAISGIAGPDGGTPDKPVGTIYIGVVINKRQKVKRFNFENNRERNIERAAMAALNMLRLELLNEF